MKKYISICLLAALLTSLAACGGETAGSNDTTDGEDTTESRYFKRTNVLKAVILKYYPDMDDVYLEHIIDEMYDELFED